MNVLFDLSGVEMGAQSKRVGKVGNSIVTIGAFTYGEENISIRQWGEGANLTIGSFCSIAKSVTIFLGGNHRTDWITTFPFGHIYKDELGEFGIKGHPSTNGDVIIGSDVWIGHGVSIMSGITIGSGAVLATNSTVVKNVSPYEVVGGNPSRKIKDRFSETIKNKLLQLSWWNLEIETIRDIAPFLSTAPTESSLDNLIAIYNT